MAHTVLVPTVLNLDGPLIDLTDVPTRQEIEDRHVELLLEHDLQDLPPLATTSELHGRGDGTLWMVGLVRFLSVRLAIGDVVEPVEVRCDVVEFV